MPGKTPTLPIDPEQRLALLNGTKLSATFPRCYGREGMVFEKFGRTFEIVKVAPIQLSFVANIFFMSEGFRSPNEFVQAWEETTGSKFRPQQRVYMHIFRMLFDDNTSNYDLPT